MRAGMARTARSVTAATTGATPTRGKAAASMANACVRSASQALPATQPAAPTRPRLASRSARRMECARRRGAASASQATRACAASVARASWAARAGACATTAAACALSALEVPTARPPPCLVRVTAPPAACTCARSAAPRRPRAMRAAVAASSGAVGSAPSRARLRRGNAHTGRPARHSCSDQKGCSGPPEARSAVFGKRPPPTTRGPSPRRRR